jgi:hypothetical protein
VIALMLDAVGTSEASLYFCETTRRIISEGSHFQAYRKSQNYQPSFLVDIRPQNQLNTKQVLITVQYRSGLYICIV